MNKQQALYSGKVKTIYASENPDLFVMQFSDSATAFNGSKKATLENKGAINNSINSFIMQSLEEKGVKTHFVKQLSASEALVKKLSMIPVECVVRNVAAGSLCRRLPIEEKTELNPPLYELFYKSDEAGDPFINESHAITFGWANTQQLKAMQKITLTVNRILSALFKSAGLILVDFKLEFGICDDQITLGDEITPDGCRIWDATTHEIFDKDRFRKDLGDVVSYYQEIAHRLGIKESVSL